MTRRGTRRSERPQSPGFLVTARALSLSLLAAAVLLIAACSTSDTNAGESVAEECSWCLTSKEPDTATPDGVLSADLIVMLDAVRANTALHDIADWVAVADIQSVCGRVADQDGAESVDAAARAASHRTSCCHRGARRGECRRLRRGHHRWYRGGLRKSRPIAPETASMSAARCSRQYPRRNASHCHRPTLQGHAGDFADRDGFHRAAPLS